MWQRIVTRPVALTEGWVCSSCHSHEWKSINRRLFTSCVKSAKDRKDGDRTPASDSHSRRLTRDQLLPNKPARTRFAPSPTGYMHIGGLRTALFSYLLARKTGGQFLLRIEDTDQKRLVHDAEDKLCRDLQWAGLQWDEGPIVGGSFGPYKQSERFHIYRDHAELLLKSQSAYRCFCTPQTAASIGAQASYVTSGCYQNCSSIPADESHHRAFESQDREAFTVRLHQAGASKRKYDDLIYGNIKRLKRSPGANPNGEEDAGAVAADTILMKSDGTPTYHFANVIDDHLMEITHVIRGTEWMASTPLHYDLYHAFGWEPPKFAHVGLLVDQNKAKLSKRSDTGLVLDVQGMRNKEGVLPVTLCNFLALLGWSNPTQNDVMDMAELIRTFDLKFTKGNTVVRNEKLWFLQKAHVARLCNQAVTTSDSAQHHSDVENDRDTEVDRIVATLCGHTSRLQDGPSQNSESGRTAGVNERALFTYWKKILLVDSKAYSQPDQFAERNQYFFSYATDLVPKRLPDLTDGVTYPGLRRLAHGLLENRSFLETLVHYNQQSNSSKALGLYQQLEQTSALVHAVINQEIFAAISKDPSLVYTQDLEAFKDVATTASSIASADKALDSADILKTYKVWNKAAMRFFRTALSYGKPGPGIAHIMAILGREECERRIRYLLQLYDSE